MGWLPKYYAEHIKAMVALPFLIAITLIELSLMFLIWPIVWITGTRSLCSIIREMWHTALYVFNFNRHIRSLVRAEGPPQLTHLRVGQAPTVLNPPASEEHDFVLMRVSAMLRRHAWGWVAAFFYAFRHKSLQFIRDDDFVELFETGPWGTYLEEVKDLNEWKVKHDGVSRYWALKMDLMTTVKYYPEMTGAGTRTLFREIPAGERDESAHLAVLAIRVQPAHSNIIYVTKPGDDAWDPAKLYVTHGATHYLVLSRHPMLHFPMDTVNARTHYLPLDHPLRTLLAPHQRFTLPLNNLVLNSGFLSILVNRALDISCFDVPIESINEFVRAGYVTYDFNKVIPTSPFGYGNFVRGYYNIFLDFVKDVIRSSHSNGNNYFSDVNVRQWGDEIHAILNGFPTGKELVEDPDLLAHALAVIMVDVSVMHGSDHSWYYHRTPWPSMPWRIRIPAPSAANGQTWIRRNANRWIDVWKFYVTQVAIFFTGPNSSLADVHYDDWIPEQQRFRKALCDYNNSLDDYHKPADISTIAPSIDF